MHWLGFTNILEQIYRDVDPVAPATPKAFPVQLPSHFYTHVKYDKFS